MTRQCVVFGQVLVGKGCTENHSIPPGIELLRDLFDETPLLLRSCVKIVMLLSLYTYQDKRCLGRELHTGIQATSINKSMRKSESYRVLRAFLLLAIPLLMKFCPGFRA